MLDKKNKKYSSPIIKAYRFGLIFLIFPFFSRVKIGNLWIIGSRIYLQDIKFKECTLISTPRDYKKIIEMPKYYRQMYFCYGLIYLSWCTKSDLFLKFALEFLLKKVIIDQPRGIVINCTKDPFNRLVTIAARRNSIKTACVQHGFMSPSIDDDLNEDDLVDFYYALNENQSRIVSRKINESKIKLLSKSTNNSSSDAEKSGVMIKNICLVGEDWERYNEYSKKELIINAYKIIINASTCNASSVNFCYRPHPSEIDYLYIDKLIPISRTDIDSFDLFIGFSSTFLWDMALKKKKCLQIFSDSITMLNFDQENICHAVEFNDKWVNNVLKFIGNPYRKYDVYRPDLSEIILISE